MLSQRATDSSFLLLFPNWIPWIPSVFKKTDWIKDGSQTLLRPETSFSQGLYSSMQNPLQASLPVLATKCPAQHFPPNSKTCDLDTAYEAAANGTKEWWLNKLQLLAPKKSICNPIDYSETDAKLLWLLSLMRLIYAKMKSSFLGLPEKGRTSLF